MNPFHKWFVLYTLRFFALFGALAIIYLLLSNAGFFVFLRLIEAQVVFLLIKSFSAELVLNSYFIEREGGFGFEINDACLGILPMALFTSLVIALPKIPLNKKILPVFFGLAFLFAFNLFRVASTILSFEFFGWFGFQLAHLLLYKYGYAVAVITAFAFVLKKSYGGKKILESAKTFS